MISSRSSFDSNPFKTAYSDARNVGVGLDTLWAISPSIYASEVLQSRAFEV
jgi:hypothetical protein